MVCYYYSWREQKELYKRGRLNLILERYICIQVNLKHKYYFHKCALSNSTYFLVYNRTVYPQGCSWLVYTRIIYTIPSYTLVKTRKSCITQSDTLVYTMPASIIAPNTLGRNLSGLHYFAQYTNFQFFQSTLFCAIYSCTIRPQTLVCLIQ